MATLDDLAASATNLETVAGSAEALLTTLSGLLVAAKNDPAQIQAIADGLNAKATELAGAIVANTPAAP